MNDELSLCLLYENKDDNKIKRYFKFVSLFELLQYKLQNINDISQIPELQFYIIGKGKNQKQIPLSFIITPGTRVLLYNEDTNELRDLNNRDITNRLYNIYKFNNAGTDYIYLMHNLEARTDKELDKEETIINFDRYQPRLKLVANKFNCLIEGRDFDIKLDGKIKFY
jgi:CRISPR-associated endonuclease Csn1